MQHIQLFKVNNNTAITDTPVTDTAHTQPDLPKDGVINIFFSGAQQFGSKKPETSIKKAAIEYVDDLKIKNNNWHLYFAQQKDPIPDKDAFGADKDTRIRDFNDYQHHYTTEHVEFAREVLLPERIAPSLKNSSGERDSNKDATKEIHDIKMHLSRINLLGFCYGTTTIQQVLLAMDRKLRERGYNKEEIKDIKSSLCCMNYAPICQIPDKNKDVPQIFFASGIDEIARRRIDYSETLGRTCDEYDLHQAGNSVVLVSHLVSPIPKALQIIRTKFDHHDPLQSPTTINNQNDGYHATLEAIEQGKVQVRELAKERDDATERLGHNLRIWFNLERRTGSQTRDSKETFAFPSTLFARWAHDILLDTIKAGDDSQKNNTPRDCKSIINHAIEQLTPEDIQQRIEQFHNANGRYAQMVETAKQARVLIEGR